MIFNNFIHTVKYTIIMNTIIDTITCPITNCVMTDPVSGSDGHTYERTAIERALQIRQESPITREIMCVSSLKLNVAIKYLCDKYNNGELNLDNQQQQQQQNDNKLDFTLESNIYKNNTNNLMLTFNATTENNISHISQDIVIAIDRSGSMMCAVTAKDENNNNIENGMSIQDIVNHAAKTVAKTLDSNSRLAVVAFDTQIQVIFDLTYMTDVNKTMAINKISTIKPLGQTNIWGAIEKAITILNERNDKSRNPAILLLTDGSPNIRPARGEVETLKRIREKSDFYIPIYTFGFGYNLEKSLLYELAKYGNGANGHISDGGMIATVFCNFTGIIMTTVAVNIELYIKSNNNSSYLHECIMGDFSSTIDSIEGYTKFQIGTIQYQQPRHIVIDIENILNKTGSSNFEYYYTYQIGKDKYTSQVHYIDNFNTINFDKLTDVNICRFQIVNHIRKMINYNKLGNHDYVIELYNYIVNQVDKLLVIDSDNLLLKGFKENLSGNDTCKGQIRLAIDNLYFKKWGEFYLDQLSRALNQEIKPNFKDEACRFGGDVFNDIVDKASDIFDTLEPPKPSLISHYNQTNQNYTQLRSLSCYNNSAGGCFSSECYVTLNNGYTIHAKYLEPNMLIKSIDHNNNIVSARIVFIYETIVNDYTDMVTLDNELVITPWHPIYYNDEWVFPSSIKSAKTQYCISYLTLVLDNYHVAYVNDIPVVTLANNFTNGILNHPYYSTSNVINSLKKHKNYNKQHIKVDFDKVIYVRDNDNLVCDIVFT